MYNTKIGRNDSCWCGSRKKYKKCHLFRDKQEPLKHWEVNKEFNSVNLRKKCSSPDSFHEHCAGNIIRAHTVPKTVSLKAIAEDGHVLGLKINFEAIRKNKGKPTLEKIGINHASTFNGFCKYHDDVIFAPLEKELFDSTPKQCFLLAYRAFAREYYAKESAQELAPLRHSVDKGKPLETQQDIQMTNFLIELGTKTAIEDLKHQKHYFELALEADDFSSARAVVFIFNEVPPVMVCGGINPDFDFDGVQLQDLMDFTKRTDYLSVTSYYDGNRGIIAFSWLKNSDETCCKLMTSLLNKEQEQYVPLTIQYMFKNFENVFVSPTWWNEATESSKNKLMKLFGDNISTEIAPNADGITKPLASYDFPVLSEVLTIGWTFERNH
ncbi:SEC-C domain-containing protein [Shewanella sp. S1-49-MNA-CIBAN-0167]|uniref:YecA family protein n=1 Tax=Shewanella sp. S1-49-MNA-CIBAN-0167 TaxID=3140468 RepID=UPI00332B4DEF